MTLVTAILDRAARQCSVVPPSSWLTDTQLSTFELRDFLSETAEDVLERTEISGPIGKTIQITGNGGESYPLPADFFRLNRDEWAVYERTSTRRACIPVASDGQWQYLSDLGSASGNRYYRMRGVKGAFEIDFYRPLSAGNEVSVSYVSDAWLSSGASDFSSNDDVSLIPRRILETGIVYRFRERKGLDYGAKMTEYDILLTRFANEQRPTRKVNMGGTEPRNPWDIPVPDFIPGA